MSTTTNFDYAKVKYIVAQVLEIEVEELTDTGNFEQDYKADSLRAIEILAALERELKIEIPQEELSRMVNLAGVCEVLKDLNQGG